MAIIAQKAVCHDTGEPEDEPASKSGEDGSGAGSEVVLDAPSRF
jgi:hypothetical protein